MSLKYLRILMPTVLIAALAIACGGGDDKPEATPTPASTETDATPTGPTGPVNPIDSYQKVQPAVIQIVAQGTFRDPEVGIASGAGSGSGFIISPEGLAVTANHVVAGAATIEVFIGGDHSRGYNATILGHSECNDLALIDIRESDPLPYLDWYEEDVQPGIDIYAAGFPLGDPEYTLSRGIVSKARANGETDWASLDYTIEHDANTQPGNSGGPIVSDDGKVIGVFYAYADVTNTSLQFAIPGEIAEDVVEELKKGDYESIGINGWAVYDQALDISGIWVAGVSAGSPAAKAGLKPGDIITALNGLPMGTDGTMSDYCDVFRTTGYNNPMNVDVLRYDTGQFLRGEINGDRPIEVVSVADTIEDDTDIDTDNGGSGYASYKTIYDDSNTITIDVPAEWRDIDGSACNYNNGTIPCLSASTDLDSYRDTYNTSGLFFALYTTPEDIQGLLSDYSAPADCDDGGTYEYEDVVYKGLYQIWEDCAGTGNYLIVLAAAPEDNSYTALLEFIVTTEADWDAIDQAFSTFYRVP